VGVELGVELGTRGAGLAVHRPPLPEVGLLVEVLPGVDVVVLGRHHVVPPGRVLAQRGRDVGGDLGTSGHRERTTFAEVVLDVYDDQRAAHVVPPMIVTGIAGSPSDSFSPSQGMAMRLFRRCSRASASVGRSGTGSPRTMYRRCSGRSCRAGSCVPWATTTSSVPAPVGWCRSAAVLRPASVVLSEDRFATGRPSASTSL